MNLKDRQESVLRKFYDAKQKQLDKDAAHSLKAYVSSLRILFGAFNSGDVDQHTFTTILSAMKTACSSPLDIDKYLNESSDFRQKIKRSSQKSLSDTISRNGGKVLLIDDQYRLIGWDMVFNAILGNNNVLYAEDKNTALKYLKEEDVSMVFLDLKLPDNPLEGISLLREIKMKRLDVPVIIFTGEDTVKYQRKCFTEGAFDYFVKEYKEEDKNYLDYYETYLDIISNALKFSGKRGLWRDVARLEDDIKTYGPPYFNEVIHYLRKAYYFLTIDEDNWLTTIILSNNNITYYGEVILQCALAIEALINKLFDDKKNMPVIKSISKGYTADRIVYGEKLRGLKSIGILDSSSEKICDEINRMRKDCVHPKKSGLIVKEEQAVTILKKAISAARQIIFSREVLGIDGIDPSVRS